jgi:NAD(P)H-hydrate epimerase
LDADAIILAQNVVFHGNALLTPHPGELAAYSGIPKEELLENPVPRLLALAREKQAVFLFKSHVMFVASPDGRLGVVDGMNPALSAGGSGDLLAGFCAGIAARCRGIPARCRGIPARCRGIPARCRGIVQNADTQDVDLYACALAGASLLIRSAGDPRMVHRFADSLELADIAADLAGAAWLPPPGEN